MLRFKQYLNPQKTQRIFKVISRGDKGIILQVRKYKDVESLKKFMFRKEDFPPRLVRGQPNMFSTSSDCIVRGITIAKGTMVVSNKIQELRYDPHIELHVHNGKVELNIEEWRRLRFEIDELFIYQGTI